MSRSRVNAFYYDDDDYMRVRIRVISPLWPTCKCQSNVNPGTFVFTSNPAMKIPPLPYTDVTYWVPSQTIKEAKSQEKGEGRKGQVKDKRLNNNTAVRALWGLSECALAP